MQAYTRVWHLAADDLNKKENDILVHEIVEYVENMWKFVAGEAEARKLIKDFLSRTNTRLKEGAEEMMRRCGGVGTDAAIVGGVLSTAYASSVAVFFSVRATAMSKVYVDSDLKHTEKLEPLNLTPEDLQKQRRVLITKDLLDFRATTEFKINPLLVRLYRGFGCGAKQSFSIRRKLKFSGGRDSVVKEGENMNWL